MGYFSIIYFFQDYSFSNFIFSGKLDVFNGFHIYNSSIPKTEKELTNILPQEIKNFIEQKYRAIWLTLTIDQTHLLKPFLDNSKQFQYLNTKIEFDLHHANNSEIVLTKWLLDNVENKIPHYCSHYAGCGACVLSKNKEVLIVQEQSGPRVNGWGVPGGQINYFETLDQGIIRETKEETGLDCQFQKLIFMRELADFKFHMNELYFFGLITKINENQELNIDHFEIAKAKWVNLQQLTEILESKQAASPTMEMALISMKDILEKISNTSSLNECMTKFTQYNDLGQLLHKNQTGRVPKQFDFYFSESMKNLRQKAKQKIDCK